MKIAEVNAYAKNDAAAAEALRQAVSAGNVDATASPSTLGTAGFDKDQLKKALKAAEKLSDYSNRRLKFEYKEEADMFQVSVMDGDEVIRRIPPDAILKMIENIKKFAGVSIDTKA